MCTLVCVSVYQRERERKRERERERVKEEEEERERGRKKEREREREEDKRTFFHNILDRLGRYQGYKCPRLTDKTLSDAFLQYF